MELNRRQFIEVAAGAAALPLERQGPKTDRDDPDDPLGVRRDFPVVRDGLYLNSAYITPVRFPWPTRRVSLPNARHRSRSRSTKC